MEIKKYAAIDIGSNAIRVLISNVIETKEGVYFQKNAFVRAPIRLGKDSFTFGEISKKSLKRIIDAMKSFKYLMKVHDVSHYKAFATSALREANISPILRASTGAMPSVGSSSSNKLLPTIKARAKATNFC